MKKYICRFHIFPNSTLRIFCAVIIPSNVFPWTSFSPLICNRGHHFTARKGSCGKVMSSHLSVILSTGEEMYPDIHLSRGCGKRGMWWKGGCGERGVVKEGVVWPKPILVNGDAWKSVPDPLPSVPIDLRWLGVGIPLRLGQRLKTSLSDWLDHITKLYIFLVFFQIPAPSARSLKFSNRKKWSSILNAFLNIECTLVRPTFPSCFQRQYFTAFLRLNKNICAQ